MIFGSVCSGIEAASAAWNPLGWSASFLSEIDPFPRAVLQHHHPEVPLHGDFTTIRAGEYPPIDLLVGGTPCQSFSVAGLRGGLGDDRGNLALEFLRLADRLRPRWVVWENVPGVLSSGGGRDFGAILGALVELGYGFAYRVLDTQYVRTQLFSRAIPQRRRRVFVVGHIRDWRRAAAVLLEPESLRGDSPPRREAGEAVAALTANGVGTCGADDNQGQAGHLVAYGGNRTSGPIEVSPALNVHPGGSRCDFESEALIAFDWYASPSQSMPTTLEASPLKTTMQPAIAIQEQAHKPTADSHGLGVRDDGAAYTLETRSPQAVQNGWQVRRLTPLECERLQGFPDDHTLVPYRGKLAKDGPRYKALGNSQSVNVMEWLGRRIGLVDRLEVAP